MFSLLQYCPACGDRTFKPNSPKSLLCSQCNFVLYLNAAAAVAAILESEGDVLLTVRGQAPSEGMLDLPGGFVDHFETVETALVRELQEELGIDVMAVMGDMMGDRSPNFTPETALPHCYVGSSPNTYHYRGMTYETVDMFYHLVLPYKPALQADDDVVDVVWVPKDSIPVDDIAFASVRQILDQCYPNQTANTSGVSVP